MNDWEISEQDKDTEYALTRIGELLRKLEFIEKYATDCWVGERQWDELEEAYATA